MKVGRVLLLFLILMGSVILFGSRGVLDNHRLDQKLSDLRKSNEELSAKNDALRRKSSCFATICATSRRWPAMSSGW